MSTKRPANEQVKHRYFHYLEQADGKSEATIRQIVIAIRRYETFTRNADFRTFDQKTAVRFKDHLSKEQLAPATILSTMKSVKRFFGWLALQPGYKSRVRQNDVEYLNMSEKSIRAASAPKEALFPTLLMVEAAVRAMPQESTIQKRNRALIAFGAITAIRISAQISLKRKHFDRQRNLVIQHPSEVDTKNSKQINTFLMPVSEYLETIFLDWVRYLDNELLFGPNDPLFPRTVLGHDEHRQFTASGVSREHWQSTQPVRTMYHETFQAANLPSFSPHSFRHMIVSEMYRRKLDVVAFKAWSQNLGHEGAMTTLTSYGKLSLEDQGRAINESGAHSASLSGVSLEDVALILRQKGIL